MDIPRMQDLSEMITNVKKAAGELESLWCMHAHGCKYLIPEEDLNCSNPDPSCDPVCEHDNYPLLKEE